MALNLVEPYDLGKLTPGSPEALHLLIEAIKVSKADIYHYLADPKFAQTPVAGMLSKSYAESRRKLIFPYIPIFHDCHTFVCTVKATADGKSTIPCYLLFKGYW